MPQRRLGRDYGAFILIGDPFEKDVIVVGKLALTTPFYDAFAFTVHRVAPNLGAFLMPNNQTEQSKSTATIIGGGSFLALYTFFGFSLGVKIFED